MGLDVIAISKAEFVGKPLNPEEEAIFYEKGYESAYSHPSYSVQAEGLNTGYYDFKARFEFRAGSYSFYNNWRNDLSKLVLDVPAYIVWANPDTYKNKPFYSLVHFSDCEGIIGPVTSAKLYKDFVDFHNGAVHYSKQLQANNAAGAGVPYWLTAYEDFMRAFEIASDGGFVSFK